jgi:hypothetical protein
MKATLVLCLSLLAAAAGAAPRIDLGKHFHVRLHNQTDSSRTPAVGQTKLFLAATVLDGRGDLVVTATQRGKELLGFRCPVARNRGTRCESPYIDAHLVDAGAPLAIAAVFVDEATDAETPLYAGSFPVLRFHDWAGDRNGRPHHVEQRALRLDSALGAVIAHQASFGTALSSEGVETVTTSEIGFAFWEARSAQRPGRPTLRCQVDGGDWQAMRLGGPGNQGEAQELRNRVKTARDVVDQRLDYQQIAFTATMPFWIAGADKQLSAPVAADGAWVCQLRDAEKRVWRELHFTVAGNQLVSHPGLALEPGRALVAVAFSEDAAPESFDPAEVRRAFMGMPWSSPDGAPLAGTPPAKRSLALTPPRR